MSYSFCQNNFRIISIQQAEYDANGIGGKKLQGTGFKQIDTPNNCDFS